MLNCSIVTYKPNWNELEKAISSAMESECLHKLYIVDNSPSNSLKGRLPDSGKIEYIFNNKNVGFGAAHNKAIKKSLEADAKYHLVLNPDVYFEKEVLSKIYNYMEQNRDIGNIMPKVVYPDGSFQNLCKLLPTPYDWIGRRFNPFKKLVERRNYLFELHFADLSKAQEIPYLSGCFMFLRVEALRKVGVFDEKIFMYGEETDLGRRLIAEGFKNVFFPDVTICHSFQKGSHKSLRLTWIGIRSAIYYFNKWGWFFDQERREINKDLVKKLKKNRDKTLPNASLS